MGNQGKSLRAVVCTVFLLAVAGGGCTSAGPGFLTARAARIANAPAPSGRTVVVVDVDETLSDTDYFHLLLRTGHEDSEPLRGASATLNQLARDFEIVYLTSRPTYLLSDTREWLHKNKFPEGPVYTADEVAELVSQRRYKTRYMADLLKLYRNAYIGIGDRASDALAYRANNMLSIIVNPDEDSEFHSKDIVLQSWADVKVFFEANAQTLKDPQHVAQAARADRYAFVMPPGLRLVRYDDVDDDHGRGELNRVLLHLFPKLRRHARNQATAADVLASNSNLRDAIILTLDKWPDAHIIDVRLNRSEGQSVVEIKLAYQNRLVSAAFAENTGKLIRSENGPIPTHASHALELSEGPRISVVQALDIASEKVDGKAYQVELRMEYDRPVYEVSLLSRKGFWEIDVDAATGKVQEVAREWRLVPLN